MTSQFYVLISAVIRGHCTFHLLFSIRSLSILSSAYLRVSFWIQAVKSNATQTVFGRPGEVCELFAATYRKNSNQQYLETFAVIWQSNFMPIKCNSNIKLNDLHFVCLHFSFNFLIIHFYCILYKLQFAPHVRYCCKKINNQFFTSKDLETALIHLQLTDSQIMTLDVFGCLCCFYFMLKQMAWRVQTTRKYICKLGWIGLFSGLESLEPNL